MLRLLQWNLSSERSKETRKNSHQIDTMVEWNGREELDQSKATKSKYLNIAVRKTTLDLSNDIYRFPREMKALCIVFIVAFVIMEFPNREIFLDESNSFMLQLFSARVPIPEEPMGKWLVFSSFSSSSWMSHGLLNESSSDECEHVLMPLSLRFVYAVLDRFA